MAIELPKARITPAPQPRKRNVPVEAILQVMGENPYANAINAVADPLSKALARRSELRREAEGVGRVEKAYGLEEGALKSLPLQTAAGVGSNIYETKAKQAVRQQNLKSIELLEKQYKLPPGSLGDDPTTARFMIGQLNMGKRHDDAQDEREKNRNLRIDKTVLDWKTRMRTDPQIKGFYSQDLGLSQVDDIINQVNQGNTIASTALGTKMARAMGEVGVLTDADVVRYVQSGRLDRKAADVLSRWITGTPTNATVGEVQQIANILRERFAEKIQPIYNEQIETLARNLDMTPDEAAYKLAVKYQPVRPRLDPIPTTGAGGQETPSQRKARLLQELQGATR